MPLKGDNLPEHITQPAEPPYNPNHVAFLARIDRGDGSTVLLETLMQEIGQMDMSAELRVGHWAGLLAAQLTLNYLDRAQFPVYERAVDIGELAMLGYHITTDEPLTPIEMDYAKRYQEVILFTRVLDDLPQPDQPPDPAYARRVHPSALSRAQAIIRLNLFGYLNSREEFKQTTDKIVSDYRTAICTTPPIGEDIPEYRKNVTLLSVIDRFLQVRRSLLDYVPQLMALDDELWHYARTHYVRYLI